MVDISEQLLEFSFRDVKCPISSFIDDGSQDMPEHKHSDQNGSRSEGTGRNAYHFNVKMVFVDGLARGINESWDNLYPQSYNDMLAALEDRSSGLMQHPERGNILCKAIKWTSSLSADMRGGRIIDVTFRETDDDTNILAPVDSNVLTSGALILENALGSLNPPLPNPGPLGQLFSDFCNDIASVGSSATLLTSHIPGKIDQVISNLNGISNSFSNAATAKQTFPFNIADNQSSFNQSNIISVDVNLGNGGAVINQLIAQMIGNLLNVKNKILGQDKSTQTFQVPFAMSLGKLSKLLKNDISTLMQLNPGLSGFKVQQNDIIEYYVK